ncbi:MAG: fluoride efflux transporter FluC [Phycicoccus sp.]
MSRCSTGRPEARRPGSTPPDAAPRHTAWPTAGALAAVALGGVLGSLGRWAVGAVVPAASGGFPWATFWVNVTGALAMGLLVAHLAPGPRSHPLVRPFFGAGLLGGWTTFSALAVDAVALASAGREAVALAYVVATFVLGVLAVPAGMQIAQCRRPAPPGER